MDGNIIKSYLELFFGLRECSLFHSKFAVQRPLFSHCFLFFFFSYQNHQQDLASLWMVMWVLSWQWCFLFSVIVYISFGNVVHVPVFGIDILSYMDILRIGSLV